MKRALDLAISVAVLGVFAPVLVLAALAVRLSSPGPVLYRARRSGRNGTVFDMLKFRSMHLNAGGPAITAHRDARIFLAGRVLRRLKIDELPQFLNVLRGEMSVVGPRPEDPGIVARVYQPWMMETLAVRPGITGPGSIYYYAVGESLVDSADPEGSYIRDLLPPKLAIERAYLERATWVSDLVCIAHTVLAVAGAVLHRPVLPLRADMVRAQRWAPIPRLRDGR